MIPAYLKDYEEDYNKDPREANRKWFKEAKYGLFLHYGLYSLMGKHEWIQLNDRIHVDQYAKLKESFTAAGFNAEEIVAFAKSCGMKYINLTTRHHESFCLWETKTTDFNSVNSPAKRNLVAELYDACEKEGMALFLYFSHGRDWRHPHAPNNDQWGGSARPEYLEAEKTYCYGEEHDLREYVNYMKEQVTELLTAYPNAAGIWLDGIAVPLNGPTAEFEIPKFYEHIWKLAPHVLVSYKQGVTGTEDFFAPEHDIPSDTGDRKNRGQITEEKTIEVCTTMIKGPRISWGYYEGSEHKSVEEVVEEVKKTVGQNRNLLLNTGLLPDGRIDSIDKSVLTEAYNRLKAENIL